MTYTLLSSYVTIDYIYHLPVSIKIYSISLFSREEQTPLLSSQGFFYHSFPFQSHPEAL